MKVFVICKTCKEKIGIIEVPTHEILDDSKDSRMKKHLGHTIEYDKVCDWCESKNVTVLHSEHGYVSAGIKAKFSGGTTLDPILACHDCGKITFPGPNPYRRRTDSFD